MRHTQSQIGHVQRADGPHLCGGKVVPGEILRYARRRRDAGLTGEDEELTRDARVVCLLLVGCPRSYMRLRPRLCLCLRSRPHPSPAPPLTRSAQSRLSPQHPLTDPNSHQQGKGRDHIDKQRNPKLTPHKRPHGPNAKRHVIQSLHGQKQGEEGRRRLEEAVAVPRDVPLA